MSLKQQDPVVSKLQDRNDSGELPHASLWVTDTSAGALSRPRREPPPPFSGSLGLPGSVSALGGGLSTRRPAARRTFGADRRGARRPLRAHVLAGAGGSASAEESRKRGQGEALQNLGPGALVGRAGAAASNRFVELALALGCGAATSSAGAGSRERP